MNQEKYKFGNLHLKNAKEVSDHAAKVIKETEVLITSIIPDKIFFLKKLQDGNHSLGCPSSNEITHDNNSTNGVSVAEKNQKTSTKELSFQTTTHQISGNIPCNAKLMQLINVIKPEFKDVIETCEKIKMWISLLIPRIEDGNNFGVSIQEEVLSEVHGVQSESIKYLDTISRYYITRAKLASKIIKYPFIDDYRRAVEEVDENEYLKLEFCLNKIKSDYVLILDILSKNYEKIKKPRSSHSLASMY